MNTANGNAKALIVEDIHKSFGPVEVLRGISLTAKEHDVISILGSSGSGKSTFLRCCSGSSPRGAEACAHPPQRPLQEERNSPA